MPGIAFSNSSNIESASFVHQGFALSGWLMIKGAGTVTPGYGTIYSSRQSPRQAFLYT
jgi:hypothetical protein